MSQPATAPALKTSSWAIASLVFGVVGLFFSAGFAGVAVLLAICCGHSGRSEVKRGQRSGAGLALAGLILGYFVLAVRILTAFAAS